MRFDFVGQTENWVFRTAVPFDAPTSGLVAEAPGHLLLQAQTNTNTFGFWESPILALDPAHPGLAGYQEALGLGSVPFQGPTGDTALYAARWTVSSTVADPARVPQLRLRATQADLAQSAFTTVDSRDDGVDSPTADGRDYTLLFSPTDGTAGFMLEFEILNFDPRDADEGQLLLDAVEVTRHNTADITGRQIAAEYTFDTDTAGWAEQRVPGMADPLFSHGIDQDPEDQALILTGPGQTGVFGYWGSPSDAVVIDASKLYIASFRIGSNVAEENRTQVPQFRARLNESTLHNAVVLAVESQDAATRSPVAGQPQLYRVYMLPRAVADGQHLVAAFDFLNFNPQDDSSASLFLYDVTIESADRGGL